MVCVLGLFVLVYPRAEDISTRQFIFLQNTRFSRPAVAMKGNHSVFRFYSITHCVLCGLPWTLYATIHYKLPAPGAARTSAWFVNSWCLWEKLLPFISYNSPDTSKTNIIIKNTFCKILRLLNAANVCNMYPVHQISVFSPKKYYFPSADGCSYWHLVKMLTKQIYTGGKSKTNN